MLARIYAMSLSTANPSIDLLAEALIKKGYKSEKITIAENTYTRLIAPNGKSWFTEDAHIGYPFVGKAAGKISLQKNLAYELCSAYGVRIPWTAEATSSSTDEELQNALVNAPLVVKPRDSSLSNGLTLNVRTISELKASIDFALRYSSSALVQEQVTGEEIRFVVIDGKVTAAMLRESPKLIGDGKQTVAELLAQENEQRAALEMRYVAYPQLSHELVTISGRKPDDVLAEGEILSLGKGTMIRDGASIYNVLESVHASHLETVGKVARVLGTRFAVVDMMLHDYTAERTDRNYAFIEFNTAPVLKLFYSCRDGKHYDVLTDLVPMLDTAITTNGVTYE